MLKLSLFKKAAYVYLLFPIIIFGLTWLNFLAAIVFSLIVIAGLIALWQRESSPEVVSIGTGEGVLVLFILVLWVFLSGIGGYSFQNWDHHSRNAVFRDLIDYAWPVVYHLDPNVAVQFAAKPTVILSYYFGFWLPAALVGKLAGWNIANLFLFLWSLVGVILGIGLTSFRTRLSLLRTTLFLIFFSGADILGVLLLRNVPGYTYPGIWPPIQHLEWWAGSLQYPSFTSGLFWTYNQFIPALIVMSLFINSRNNRNSLFLLGTCFFFAPLPALGLLPFVVGNLIKEVVSVWSKEHITGLISTVKNWFTYENLAGTIVGALSAIFYSTNLSAQSKGFGSTVPFALCLMFFLLEGLSIWLLLLPSYRKDWSWYLTGVILTIAPLIRLGASWDFMMRTTLPSFYLLFVGCCVFLSKTKSLNPKAAFLVSILILGALTPIYELNRSVVRTDRFYGYHIFPRSIFEPYFQNPPATSQLFVPELDHLDTLTADDWITVSVPNRVGWTTKVGNLFSPPFALMWDQNLIQR